MANIKDIFNKSTVGEKFFVFSTFGELLDVAIALKDEGKEVVLYVPDPDYKKIGEGIVEKAENWHEYVGRGYVWVVDGCENAKLQDWLRAQGESVVGTNEAVSEYENDRQKGQEWFKELGFPQTDSWNFTDFDEALEHVKEYKSRLILKQNGDAPKHLNHMGKFESGIDMIHHLEELKKSWNETEYGEIDFDLMEVCEGMEVAASAFFNGHDWLRDKDGKVVGFLNWEHKKESDGDLGETTGEMGTLFLGVDETNETFSDIILRKGVKELLKKHNFRGVFDINGCVTDEGFVGFEPTCRFGVPATSYEFLEGMATPISELLIAMAKGLDAPIETHKDWGIVQVVAAKPYPVEADVEERATSIGEKLWILKDEEPIKDFTKEQKKHIHLENFYKKEGDYVVATKSGYLLTVTMRGDDIESVRDDILEYIKENIFISGMKFRTDIGKKIEEEYD